MIRRSAAIGLCLLLLPLPAAALESTLYLRMKEAVEADVAAHGAEPAVEAFVTGVETTKREMEIGPWDLDLALQERRYGLCREPEEGGPLNFAACEELKLALPAIARKEQRVRALGRDLALIAHGYEAPLDDELGSPLELFPRIASILAIWQSGNDPYTSPTVETHVEAEPMILKELPTLKEAIENVGKELGKLVAMADADACKEELGENYEDFCDEYGKKENLEQLTAAVWRYRDGARQVERTAEEDCDPAEDGQGDGTELGLLSARWCDVEKALEKVWDERPEKQKDEPGSTITLYFPGGAGVFPGVSVWVRSDDAGLAWKLPGDPVFPALACDDEDGDNPACVDGMLLGGTYPDEPEDPELGTGLCSHPFARRGYLCRPLDKETCNNENAEGQIVLTECRGPALGEDDDGKPLRMRITEAGPNICSAGPWRDPPEDGPEDGPAKGDVEPPGMCQNCSVDLYCGDECEFGGKLMGKNDKGVLSVCISKERGAMTPYLMMHELAHAQQYCNRQHIPGKAADLKQELKQLRDKIPDLEGQAKVVAERRKEQLEFGIADDDLLIVDKDVCCAVEYEAYLVMCNALAEDGIIRDIDVPVEKCAAMLSNFSCSDYGDQACSGVGTKEEVDAFWKDLQESADALKEVRNLPDSCEEAIRNPGARVLSQRASMPGLCNPTCEAEYRNSVGNNFCYAGQCLEQSLEEHRLIPGRMTGVSGQAYPYDAPIPDPEHGNVLAASPLETTMLPAYAPALLLEELDRALCQLNGLPVLTPPVLCQTNPLRTIGFGGTFATATQGLYEQPSEYGLAARGLEEMAPGVGAQMATDLLVSYLEPAIRTLRDLLDTGSSLMQDIASTGFPRAMCPAGLSGITPPQPNP